MDPVVSARLTFILDSFNRWQVTIDGLGTCLGEQVPIRCHLKAQLLT